MANRAGSFGGFNGPLAISNQTLPGSDDDFGGNRPNIRTRGAAYNSAVRQNNFFSRPMDNPIMSAGMQVMNPKGNLPALTAGKPGVTTLSNAETKESDRDGIRRSSQGNFNIRRPKMGDVDFDYNTLNMNLRMRDMETKLVDLKGDMERRILQIIEESPMKFLNALRQLEERETTLWADNMEKHNKQSDAIQLMSNRQLNTVDSLSTRMAQMQKKMEEISYKNTELERSVSNLTKHNRDLLDNNMNALDIKQQAGREIQDVSSEIKSLKDRFATQEETRLRFFKDLAAQVDGLSALVLKSENDIYSRMREQKKQLIEEVLGGKEQHKRLEEMRMEKILSDNEYMKSLMESLERKIKGEVAKRIGAEFDQKGFLEAMVNNFKDEMKGEQRDILEAQNNLVREVQESIGSLSMIVKNTRDEMMATVNSSQLLTTENMRNLTKALEVVKDNMLDRVAALDGNMVDLNKKMDTTQDAFNENTIRVTQTMEAETARVDKIMNRFEDLVTESTKAMNDRIQESENRQKAWRAEYEEKNQNIFKEMSAALRSLKRQLSKATKEGQDRDEELQRQIDASKKLAEGLFKNMEDKNRHLEEVFQFRLDENTKVVASHLQREVDKMLEAVQKNTEYMQEDVSKRLASLRNDTNRLMFETVDKENMKIKDLVADTKRNLEDSTISKIKDAEVRLEGLFRSRFDDYRVKLEDSIREFNRLKTDLESIRKDYYGALEGVRDDLRTDTRKEVDSSREFLLQKIKETKDTLDEEIESKTRNMRQEVALNREDMLRAVDAAKLDVESGLLAATNDIKNMVDQNDQIIHADVNGKMRSLTDEIQISKKYMMDRMDELHESSKSLARALVNEEAANRANKDEMIIKLFDRKINNLNSYILSIVEQKLDEVKIELENKIKDTLIALDEFKRFTLDEFSAVRTEHEQFKQEYYARDYADHLYLLTLADQVQRNFDGVQAALFETQRVIEENKAASEERDSVLQKDLKKEQLLRKEADEDIRDEHEKYKTLNERTFEELITLMYAELETLKVTQATGEEAIYDSIRRIVEALGSLGGESNDLLSRIEKNEGLFTQHTEKVVKQDKENKKHFDKVEKEHRELEESTSQFQEVAKNNFKTTEDALSILSNLINSLESYVLTDNIMTNNVIQMLGNHCDNRIDELDTKTTLVHQDAKDYTDEEMRKLDVKVKQEYIPQQVLLMKENLDNNDKDTKAKMGNLNQQMQETLSKQKIQLEDHTEQLRKHEKRLNFAEENLQDAGDDFKKIEKAIGETNAQLVGDTLSTQAELNNMRAAMSETVSEIYSLLAKMKLDDADDDQVASDLSSRVKAIEKQLKEPSAKSADLEKLKKDMEKLSKEVDKLQQSDKKDDKKDKDSKDGKKDKDAGKTDSKELKALQANIAALQQQVKEYDERITALEEKKGDGSGDGDDDEEDKSEKSDKKKKGNNKPKKISKQKAKKDDDDEEDGENADDSTDVDEKIEKKVNELREELLEEIKKKQQTKGKKDDTDEDDEEKDDKSDDKGDKDGGEKVEKLEERLDQLEKDLEELKEKKGKGKDDSEEDDKDSKKGGDDEKLKELEEELNGKIAELEEKIEKLGEKGGKDKSDDGDDDDKDKDGDLDEKIQEKIDKLKDELKEELKEELKGDGGDDDEKGSKDNQKVWDEIETINEKLKEIDQLAEQVGDLEKKVEELAEKED